MKTSFQDLLHHTPNDISEKPTIAEIRNETNNMKDYTVFWEDRWQSGSQHYCLTKKTWIRCNDIKTLMESDYGQCAIFILEEFQVALGETMRYDEVITL